MADTEPKIEPQAIIVALYDSADAGRAALKELKHVRKDKDLAITDVALLRKNEKGKVRISETADWSGRKGAAVGGVAGAALGVITGGVGFLALGGAAVAGLASRLRDSGFDNEQLKAITTNLDPNSAAVLVVCSEAATDACVEVCKGAGAVDLYRVALDMQLTADLYVERVELESVEAKAVESKSTAA